MKSLDSDQLRGHLNTLVLAALEQGEGHGLEIIYRLEARGAGALKLREGSLYPALYRLENLGLVTSSVEKQAQGKRGAPRRIYRLTGKGKSALGEGRQQWRQFTQIVGELIGVSCYGAIQCA
jgi:DNA-binding PadR family transcriptional regulator